MAEALAGPHIKTPVRRTSHESRRRRVFPPKIVSLFSTRKVANFNEAFQCS